CSLRARGTLTALGRSGRSHERGSARDGKFGEGKMTWNTVRSARPPALIGRRLRLMALLLGAGAMAACASAGSVGQRAAAAAMTPTSIVIENNSWDRVTVYISRGDQLWRLGDVSALA